jgi:hypothetical protein
MSRSQRESVLQKIGEFLRQRAIAPDLATARQIALQIEQQAFETSESDVSPLLLN